MGESHTRNPETAKPQKRHDRKLTAGAASVAAALLAATMAVSSGPATAQGTYVTTEPAGGDLAEFEATEGVVRVGTDSTGRLTAEHDAPGSAGDWWRLDIDGSYATKRYLVEVAFGSTVTADKGGGIEVYFTDWNGQRTGWGDQWDHNRDDGAAFLFMPGDRRPHFLRVQAQDFLNEGSLTYYGNYTITLTDITDVETQVSNLVASPGELETGLNSTNSTNNWTASKVTTGSNTGGYRLEWVVTELKAGTPPVLPQVSLYTDSSGSPGTKVFDFIAPAAINSHPSPRGQDFALAPNTSAATLAASTSYWIVFKETGGADADSHYLVPIAGTAAATTTSSGWSIRGAKYSDRTPSSPSWVALTIQTPITFSVHAVNVGGA